MKVYVVCSMKNPIPEACNLEKFALHGDGIKQIVMEEMALLGHNVDGENIIIDWGNREINIYYEDFDGERERETKYFIEVKVV